MKKKSMIVLIVMLVIGFAAVSTTLIINAVVGVGTNQDSFTDGVVFDKESLTSSEGTTAKISASGRTITFTTQEMKSVGEEAKVKFKIKNYSQYNAVLGTPAISCYYVDDYEVDTKANPVGTTNEYMKLIPGSDLDGTTIAAGGGLSVESSVTVKQIKSYVGENQTIKFQCEINARATDSETSGIEKPLPIPSLLELPEGITLTSDKNEDGVADIGDEITVGTESFYVISHTDTELNALAKYNLNVGSNKNPDVTEGIQHETVKGYLSSGTKYGNVAFSNQKGWQTNATIDIRNWSCANGPVKDALYGENGYESYIQETIPIAKVRLITKGELEALGCDSSSNTCASSGKSWLYSTTYWTQSAHSRDTNCVWDVTSRGDFPGHDASHGANDGVRPVITIPLS